MFGQNEEFGFFGEVVSLGEVVLIATLVLIILVAILYSINKYFEIRRNRRASVRLKKPTSQTKKKK